MFKSLLEFLGIKSERTFGITKHIFWSFLFKGGHLASTFLIIPITIDFLDNDNYGVWLTIISFIGWFSLFDIGMGNGLRNRFAEALAQEDVQRAKGYVSTAFYSVGCICTIFLVLSFTLGFWLEWTRIFNANPNLSQDLGLLMPVVFGCFSIRLLLNLISSMYVANKNHSFQGMVSFIISFSSLIAIWLLTKTSKSSLLIFGYVVSILPILILAIINFRAFNGIFKEYVPKFQYWRKEYFQDILGLSFSFFVIQSSLIVLFGTDNFLIAQLFEPKEVVPYNVAQKYISISAMILTIIITPYWSSFTDAWSKGEIDWIKKSMRNLVFFSFGVLLFILFLVLVSPWVYELWLGNTVEVPRLITVFMAIFFAITMTYAPYNYFINGLGKIRVQMFTMLFGALLNIPLSILLVKQFGFGVEGIILATIFCVLPNLIFFPIQYYKLINNNAEGIWSK